MASPAESILPRRRQSRFGLFYRAIPPLRWASSQLFFAQPRHERIAIQEVVREYILLLVVDVGGVEVHRRDDHVPIACEEQLSVSKWRHPRAGIVHRRLAYCRQSGDNECGNSSSVCLLLRKIGVASFLDGFQTIRARKDVHLRTALAANGHRFVGFRPRKCNLLSTDELVCRMH